MKDKMVERSKTLGSGPNLLRGAWVQIPLLSYFFHFHVYKMTRMMSMGFIFFEQQVNMVHKRRFSVSSVISRTSLMISNTSYK